MLNYIVRTIFFLIVSPQKGWKQIVEKDIEHQKFIGDFLFPIFGFVAITTLVGGLWLVENGGIHDALKQTIAVVTALFGGFYLASYLLNELFPKFGLEKDFNAAQQFTGYSSVLLYLLFFVTPLLLGFEFLWLAAIYTLYIVYAGSACFLQVDKSQRVSFAVIASLVIVLVPLIINFLLSLLIKVMG